MRLFKLGAIVFAAQILISQAAFSQYEEESQDQVENSVPEKVYVQTTPSRDINRTISREGENCFYNDEHQHIHCYEDERYKDDPYEDESYRKTETRVVYRTSNRTYRDRDYSPSALSIGLAIGIPLLIHSSYRHGYRSHHRSHHRSHYRQHRSHYSRYNRGYNRSRNKGHRY